MNASNTKNIYTQSGFYNDFSVLIDQTGVIRYKGSGVAVSEITSWIDNLLLTSIDNKEVLIPSRIILDQNYPNPFNPSTTIKFEMQQKQHVKLEIFDITGKLIRKLIDNEMNAGAHELSWNGEDAKGNQVNSGLYFYSLKSSSKFITKKMTLLR